MGIRRARAYFHLSNDGKHTKALYLEGGFHGEQERGIAPILNAFGIKDEETGEITKIPHNLFFNEYRSGNIKKAILGWTTYYTECENALEYRKKMKKHLCFDYISGNLAGWWSDDGFFVYAKNEDAVRLRDVYKDMKEKEARIILAIESKHIKQIPNPFARPGLLIYNEKYEWQKKEV